MKSAALIVGGRFPEAERALEAELAACSDPGQMLAVLETARKAALAARAEAVDELLRVQRRRRHLRGY
jgi:hypothetical protein